MSVRSPLPDGGLAPRASFCARRCEILDTAGLELNVRRFREACTYVAPDGTIDPNVRSGTGVRLLVCYSEWNSREIDEERVDCLPFLYGDAYYHLVLTEFE